MAKLILLIEDEKDLVQTLEYSLRQKGYHTRSAHTGREGLRLVDQLPLPDLVLLDLMLPDLSGHEVCRRIRASSRNRSVPILILTAKGEDEDRIEGFERGADDYVVKPFSVRELLLRIQAILRRAPGPAGGRRRLRTGCLEVDVDARDVRVEGRRVSLSPLEYRLLLTFLESRGRVQTRDVLLEKAWDIHADVQTRTVDVHVKRLRHKLGPAADYIETLRGIGYRFRSASDGNEP